MMRSRFLPLAGLRVPLAVAFLGGALWWAKASRAPLWTAPPNLTVPKRGTLPAQRNPRAPYDPALVHKTLEFYAERSRADPGDAITLGLLANQYLESYRETGDSADALRAEQAARKSLALRSYRNSPALFALSRALLTGHRFSLALATARMAAAHDPIAWRECADIELETGDYAAAERDLRRSSTGRGPEGSPEAQPSDEDPAFLTLVARLKELRGDSKGQLALLTRAVALADANPEIPVQSVAWFHERLGRAQSMTGDVDGAEKSYRAGLAVFPRDYRTLAALAHLSAARGDWKQTIEWGQKAAQIVPAPETLALLGDAYAALGQPQKAAAQWKLVEQIGGLSRAQGVLYDRQLALFYADHGRHLTDAVKLARGELRARHDIYSFDTLAWTLFKTGRFDEAQTNAQRALAFGTRDAGLYFHAGMIAAAQHKNALARTYLERALQINPTFHPTQPAQARAELARLNAPVIGSTTK